MRYWSTWKGATGRHLGVMTLKDLRNREKVREKISSHKQGKEKRAMTRLRKRSRESVELSVPPIVVRDKDPNRGTAKSHGPY